jgi:peroxiredoxin
MEKSMTINIHCSKLEREDYTDGWRSLPSTLPVVTFRTRVYDSTVAEPNPYTWKNLTSWDFFGGGRVLIFSLPGAFTPTCDTFQLPRFEELAPEFYEKGINDIYCVSVNDAFVMNQWAKSQNLSHVTVLPDGSGHFTRAMDMQVQKDNLGFGERSWRYAVIADNGNITDWFIEEGKTDDAEEDPYLYTNPEYILSKI